MSGGNSLFIFWSIDFFFGGGRVHNTSLRTSAIFVILLSISLLFDIFPSPAPWGAFKVEEGGWKEREVCRPFFLQGLHCHGPCPCQEKLFDHDITGRRGWKGHFPSHFVASHAKHVGHLDPFWCNFHAITGLWWMDRCNATTQPIYGCVTASEGFLYLTCVRLKALV